MVATPDQGLRVRAMADQATAAALESDWARAVELNADVILKGTRVDGVYDSDPEKNPGAFKFQEISYLDVLKKDLKVMDLTAITLCKENMMPIIVFNMNVPGSLKRIVHGERVGTIVSSSPTIRDGSRSSGGAKSRTSGTRGSRASGGDLRRG